MIRSLGAVGTVSFRCSAPSSSSRPASVSWPRSPRWGLGLRSLVRAEALQAWRNAPPNANWAICYDDGGLSCSPAIPLDPGRRGYCYVGCGACWSWGRVIIREGWVVHHAGGVAHLTTRAILKIEREITTNCRYESCRRKRNLTSLRIYDL